MAAKSSSDQTFGQCRCCLDFGYHKEIGRPYYSNGVRQVYRETFLETFNLSLSKNKKLMNMICESCINRLNDATEFKAMVVKSERQLLSKTESVSSNTELTYVGQDNDTDVQKDHNNTILKKEEDNDWNNDGDEMDTQDVVEEQGTEVYSRRLIENRPAIQLTSTTIETTDTHEGIEPSNLILRKNKKTGIKCRTKKMNKINTDIKSLNDVKKTDNILLSSNFIKKQSIDSDYLGKCLTTQYSCTLCKYTTNTKKYFKYHLKDHSPPEKNYICDTCSYITARRSAFLAHLKLHAGDNPFGCEKCGRKFASRHGLINHDRTHTGEKPFSCEICGKTFIQISILRRTHTGEKPYACKICGKKFSQKGSLITHDKTHTGEKPYACEFCDAKFARKDNLKSHVQTHTGERPHACKICDKRFISTSDVRKHMRRHTGEMPYSCKICNENLCSISDLRKHTETHRDEK